MRITSTTVHRYRLPLTQPLTSPKDQITVRAGIVLTLHSDTGLQGYGEIAPLPGLHRESLSEVTEQLLQYRPRLTDISVSRDILSFDGSLARSLPAHLLPSLRSGLEMALLDLLLQTGPLPSNLPDSLPINALLIADHRALLDRVDQLLLQGFSSIKIKVARQPIEKDITDIARVLSSIQGRASLRLDANRRWTLEQAQRFCRAVDPHGIEYLEEPTQDPADHTHLIKCTPIPLALDETLTETTWQQLNPQSFRAVILKPSVLGGFEKTARIIRWAQAHGKLAVISSAFQTSLAHRMYLFFAALHHLTEIPLGLDVGKWFQEDLLSAPLTVEDGRMSLACLQTRPQLRPDLLQTLEE